MNGTGPNKRNLGKRAASDIDKLNPTVTQLYERPSSSEGQGHQFEYSEGARIGRFQIEGPLGFGAMGEVYEATDKDTDRRVALKVLSAQRLGSAANRSRFFREGQLAASINHPNSLYIFGTEEIEDVPLIASELCTGGDLNALVNQEGPLEQKTAVDLIIQICEGLKAAQEAGVLHRDIKPSNCFLSNRDQTKIGDFGLSVSRLDIDSTRLTMEGSFLGTPAFAAPEQVRGQEVDVRADIYSVGATLYFLLSGETPFAGYSGAALFAAILEMDHNSLIEKAPNTSPGLVHVISRCLHKESAKRYQGYPELIKDLKRYSSQVPRSARPGMRILAGFIDFFFGGAVGGILANVLMSIPDGFFMDLVISATIVTITGIPEGIWGSSLGKALTGLRVQDYRGAVPGLRRGLARAFLFYFLFAATATPGDLLPGALPFLIPVFVFSIPFIQARKRNSWRGLHERFTATRVIGTPVHHKQKLQAFESDLHEGPFEYELGPYQLASEYKADETGAILLGFDPQLSRKVWIQTREYDAPDVSPSRRDIGALSRLRWLNSKRSPTESWDVYEAPEGAPLATAAAAGQPWPVVWTWLTGLLEAMEFLFEKEAVPHELAVDRIWITTTGHLVWLDFPAPGQLISSTQLPKQTYTADLAGIQDLLIELCEMGSRGVAEKHQPRFPLSVAAFKEKMNKRALGSRTELLSHIVSLGHKPAELSRGRRGAMLLLPSVVIISVLLIVGLIGPARETMVTIGYLKTLQAVVDNGSLLSDPSVRNSEWAIRIHLAGPMRETLSDTSLTDQFKEIVSSGLWTELTAANIPSQDEVKEADKVLSDRSFVLSNSIVSWMQNIFPRWIQMFFIWSPVFLIFGILLNGGILYRIFGIAVITQDGLSAKKLRMGARTLIAWLPLLICWIRFIDRRGAWYMGEIDSSGLQEYWEVFLRGCTDITNAIMDLHWFYLGFFIIFIVGAIWAIVSPERGLHDRLAGTYLVRR